MQFRILGPLELWADDALVALGGRKPRTLLAALLVASPAVVSTDRLLHILWGDEPPAEAMNALHAYVSRLRSGLGAPPRLTYRAPGYLIEVADGELDSGQFVRLLHQARAHCAAGEHARVVDVLDAALALWRGDAFADFADCDFATTEIARLTDLRLAAVEERIDALLQLDRAVPRGRRTGDQPGGARCRRGTGVAGTAPVGRGRGRAVRASSAQ